MSSYLKQLFLAVLLGAVLPAQAQLARVGPVDTANGFPAWYQDQTGLALDLCVASAADLVSAICLIGPANVPNPTSAEAFPGNFSDEHFWWAADASATLTNGGKAILVLALESAFANGPVVPGDQVAFSRIRVKITNLPVSGTYRITHPYGTEVFPDQVAGGLIFMTDDVGLSCPDFSCATQSRVGPFLRPSLTPGGAPSEFIASNGKTYIGDAATPGPVTGSPFGTNFFRVEVDTVNPITGNNETLVLVDTDQFTVMGRVHTDPIPSPMAVERASFSRSSNGSGKIDVFASASPGIGMPIPNLMVSGNGFASKQMTAESLGNNKYRFYAQLSTNSVPAEITVTNSADTPVTTQTVRLSDMVQIDDATYDPSTQALWVAAHSSDAQRNPHLFVDGYGKVDGKTFPSSAPPTSITVRSEAGGWASALVSTMAVAAPAQDAPMASDDSANTLEDTPVVIDILQNDQHYKASTVALQAAPGHGSATVDPVTGMVTYVPALNYNGIDSFTYVVRNDAGVGSNVAVVNVNIAPVNDPPVANPDSASAVAGQSTAINVLANDTDPDGIDDITHATVEIVTAPANGTLSGSGSGLSYRPVDGYSGPDSFTYRLIDPAGAVSNVATVSLTVASNEALAVTRAQFRTSQSRWVITGTDNILAGQTITIKGANGVLKDVVIGTATVDAAGLWEFRQDGSSISPVALGNNTTLITVTSSLTRTSRTVTLSVIR